MSNANESRRVGPHASHTLTIYLCCECYCFVRFPTIDGCLHGLCAPNWLSARGYGCYQTDRLLQQHLIFWFFFCRFCLSTWNMSKCLIDSIRLHRFVHCRKRWISVDNKIQTFFFSTCPRLRSIRMFNSLFLFFFAVLCEIVIRLSLSRRTSFCVPMGCSYVPATPLHADISIPIYRQCTSCAFQNFQIKFRTGIDSDGQTKEKIYRCQLKLSWHRISIWNVMETVPQNYNDTVHLIIQRHETITILVQTIGMDGIADVAQHKFNRK